MTTPSEGEAIVGAIVNVGSLSATTNSNGDYTITGAPGGAQTVTTTATHFVKRTDTTTITAGATTVFSPVMTPAVPALPRGTVLSVRSAETDQPVAGASLSLSGAESPAGSFDQTYACNGAGQLTLDRTVFLSPTPRVEVRAAGFLLRETLLRLDEATVSLWPTSSGGLDETSHRQSSTLRLYAL